MPRESSILLGWQDCDGKILDLKSVVFEGITPLMMACANAHDDCVKISLKLLDNDISITAVKKKTDTWKR